MRLDLLITAITPGIALAIIIYLTDRYNKEPIQLLVKVFLLGMGISFPVILLEGLLSFFNVFSGILHIAYTSFIVAGFSEEFFKRLIVTKVALKHSAFDEKLDGIVYSVFASLGFATLENIIYVVFTYANIDSNIGLQRAIFAVPAHMLFAITMGYHLSLAKFAPNKTSKNKYLIKSLVSPILLHGSYNFIVMSNFSFLLLILIPFMIYLWIINIRRLNIYYQESKGFNSVLEVSTTLETITLDSTNDLDFNNDLGSNNTIDFNNDLDSNNTLVSNKLE